MRILLQTLGSGLFAPLAAHEGIPFVATGIPEKYRESIMSEDLWHPRKGIRLVLERGAEPQLEPMLGGPSPALRAMGPKGPEQ